jgi:hypothetical protein
MNVSWNSSCAVKFSNHDLGLLNLKQDQGELKLQLQL